MRRLFAMPELAPAIGRRTASRNWRGCSSYCPQAARRAAPSTFSQSYADSGRLGAGLRLKPATSATLPSIEYWEDEQRPVHLEFPWDSGAISRVKYCPSF